MNIKLQDITQRDFQDIKKLTQNKNVMKFIGNSEIWSDVKVNKFIKYNVLEQENSDILRENYYYKITNNNIFAGIIGFHKFKPLKTNNLYLTIYIQPELQGQGIFSQSLKLLIRKIHHYKQKETKLYSLVRNTNKTMNSISQKKFTFDKQVTLNQTLLNQYLIYLDIPKEYNTYQKKFYLVRENYFNPKMIHDTFSKLNKNQNNDCFWEEYNLKKPQNKVVNFLFVDCAYWSKPYITRLQSEYRSILDSNKNKIVKKDNLFKNESLKKQKFVLQQFTFNINRVKTKQFKSIFTSKKWILKPVDGFSGKFISIFNNYDDLVETIQEHQKTLKGNTNKKTLKTNTDRNKNKNKTSKTDKYREWVLQEYIDNPLLFKKKKFHIRCYLVYLNNNTCFLMKAAKIFVARKEYIASNYKNKDIHDTHALTSDKPYYLERDIKKHFGSGKYNLILKQMVTLFKKVFQNTNIGCYSDTKNCYEIFGADLMVTDKFEVKLIEINNKIGYHKFPDDPVDLHKIIFSNLVDIVLQRFELDTYIQVKGNK